jgi:cytochrome c peroxidase
MAGKGVPVKWMLATVVIGISVGVIGVCTVEETAITASNPPSSYAPVVAMEPFEDIMARMSKDKDAVMKKQMDLLAFRYDLKDSPLPGVTMTRGKAVQGGVRIKLKDGVTWDSLAKMSPAEIREKELCPEGFLPLPHPNHPEGGMVFPKFHIDEMVKQTSRDLTRFDLDFDIPDQFLAEFPPAVFLTTRPDLGDVSQGKVITTDNYHEMFNGVLNPKQSEGLRLLVTPFPQQQFNATEDRRSAHGQV